MNKVLVLSISTAALLGGAYLAHADFLPGCLERYCPNTGCGESDSTGEIGCCSNNEYQDGLKCVACPSGEGWSSSYTGTGDTVIKDGNNYIKACKCDAPHKKWFPTEQKCGCESDADCGSGRYCNTTSHTCQNCPPTPSCDGQTCCRLDGPEDVCGRPTAQTYNATKKIFRNVNGTCQQQDVAYCSYDSEPTDECQLYKIIGESCNISDTVCPGCYCAIGTTFNNWRCYTTPGRVKSLGRPWRYMPESGFRNRAALWISPSTMTWNEAYTYCLGLKRAYQNQEVANGINYGDYPTYTGLQTNNCFATNIWINGPYRSGLINGGYCDVYSIGGWGCGNVGFVDESRYAACI